MLDHTGIVVTDLVKARKFYDAVAKALGLGIVTVPNPARLLRWRRLILIRCPGTQLVIPGIHARSSGFESLCAD